MEQLPEDMIEHILSYLELKDGIRIGAVCKKLYRAWSLHPILKLRHDEVSSQVAPALSYYLRVREEFVNYAKKSLERYLNHDQIPQQLHLTINSERYTSSSSPMIDKLLQIFEEIGGVGVRAIRFFYTSADESYPVATNLFRVLQCKALVEFNVEICNLIMEKQIGGKEMDQIRCHLLRRLILWNVCTDEDTIQSIISACPVIENLQIRDCSNLRRIKVVNNYCLKEIAFSLLHHVEVQVPNLESLFVKNVGYLGGLESYPYQNMKILSLECVSIADSFFQEFSSKFPNLENCSAIDCIGHKGGNISGNSLKYVTLKSSCKDTRQPEINAPNLVSFIYECSEIPRFVSTIASSVCECKLKIKMECLVLHGGASFFTQLKETLKRLMKTKLSLSISFNSISNIKPGVEGEDLSLEWSSSNASDEPGVEVEHLTLYKAKDATWSSTTYSSFVDSLFWSCRPKSIYLCQDRFAKRGVDFDVEFGKVFCERLLDRKPKSKLGRWENDLKGVKKIDIEKIDLINNRESHELVSIEDGRMLGAIPCQFLLGDLKICFFIRLEW